MTRILSQKPETLKRKLNHSSPETLKRKFKYPCPRCGSTSSRIGAGRRPQEASLHCADCKRFVRWLSASEFAKGGEK